MFGEIMNSVRREKPIVHCITNYVTVNDCANILLASGASPIMADDISEVSEITSIASGLDINIGTLNSSTVESMMLSGSVANKLEKPVLLDPVGVGASKLRTETANALVNAVKFNVIRGNASEIKVLAGGRVKTRGVDTEIALDSLEEQVEMAKSLSHETGAIISITGETDIVASTDKVYLIKNGHKMMTSITGTGCMLSALITAFISANVDREMEAVLTGVACMGICGELAFERLKPNDGNLTYRNYIIDEIYNMTSDKLESRIKYEVQ